MLIPSFCQGIAVSRNIRRFEPLFMKERSLQSSSRFQTPSNHKLQASENLQAHLNFVKYLAIPYRA